MFSLWVFFFALCGIAEGRWHHHESKQQVLSVPTAWDTLKSALYEWENTEDQALNGHIEQLQSSLATHGKESKHFEKKAKAFVQEYDYYVPGNKDGRKGKYVEGFTNAVRTRQIAEMLILVLSAQGYPYCFPYAWCPSKGGCVETCRGCPDYPDRTETCCTNNDADEEPPTPEVCTADVKRCEDGSFVSRVPPFCYFADCPPPPQEEEEIPVIREPVVEESPPTPSGFWCAKLECYVDDCCEECPLHGVTNWERRRCQKAKNSIYRDEFLLDRDLQDFICLFESVVATARPGCDFTVLALTKQGARANLPPLAIHRLLDPQNKHVVEDIIKANILMERVDIDHLMGDIEVRNGDTASVTWNHFQRVYQVSTTTSNLALGTNVVGLDPALAIEGDDGIVFRVNCLLWPYEGTWEGVEKRLVPLPDYDDGEGPVPNTAENVLGTLPGQSNFQQPDEELADALGAELPTTQNLGTNGLAVQGLPTLSRDDLPKSGQHQLPLVQIHWSQIYAGRDGEEGDK
eukprot:TRINITY_DN49225_c0_g2_i1.p1 TRINITY_DN49225_c0_g2~~TRINITY_DN49225_c0_g2_i1.p1  ORF type:complete len:517 (-),score=45.52 TRINITY_DN49225_c0_g2_i1:53-1603(-)